MAEHADPLAQLAEYESQLADVIEMLVADPHDESMIKLRDDLTELIALTKSELASKEGDGGNKDESGTSGTVTANMAATVSSTKPPPVSSELESAASVASSDMTHADASSSSSAPAKKSKKKSKTFAAPGTFEIPDHLKPLPSDTDAERKRKLRTVKALKSKWRERKKEAEGKQKQKSWKDFVDKKGSGKRERSIFATEDGVNAKVGVISGTTGVRGGMTEFDGRKRHKH